MGMFINLEKKIQVLNNGKWENACVKVIGSIPSGEVFMTVRFNDFTEKTLSDVFGIDYDMWRYAERLCEQCIYDEIEGGDAVHYGSSTVYTPEWHVCNCPNVDLEDPYEELEEGSKCEHFKSNTVYTGISREDFRRLCISNSWCTACSNSQYERLFEMLEDGTNLRTLALIVSMFSVGVSEKEVFHGMSCFCDEGEV